MWTMTVVVLDVFGENLGQISLVEDQHPVEHLTAERAEVPPTFRTVTQLRLSRLEREGLAAPEEELLSRVSGRSCQDGDRDIASDRSGCQRARYQ
jgi:hypothetical protein